MYNFFTDKIIDKLNLTQLRYDKVYNFLKTTSYYKLLPYIDFIRNNPEIEGKIRKNNPECKDAWDSIVIIYMYNIKLSIAIYPYIYILENTLKTQINNSLCTAFGINWYKNPDIYVKSNKKRKTCEYLLGQNNKYLSLTKYPTIGDFVENNTTFGYWSATMQVTNLWDSKEIKLKQLFINDSIKDLISVPTLDIYNKLNSINDLRNKIAHHNQIIGREISTRTKHSYRLWDIYMNICYLLNHLGCSDINWMISDLCKNQTSFENLYQELEFIHSSNIKPDKV